MRSEQMDYDCPFDARFVSVGRLCVAPARHNLSSRAHCNFAYSALACFRMGMSGSASFQRVRKSV
jgi:hypothetical protein